MKTTDELMQSCGVSRPRNNKLVTITRECGDKLIAIIHLNLPTDDPWQWQLGECEHGLDLIDDECRACELIGVLERSIEMVRR